MKSKILADLPKNNCKLWSKLQQTVALKRFCKGRSHCRLILTYTILHIKHATSSWSTNSAPKYGISASLPIHFENKPLRQPVTIWLRLTRDQLFASGFSHHHIWDKPCGKHWGGSGREVIRPHQTSRCESTFRYCYHHLQPSTHWPLFQGIFPPDCFRVVISKIAVLPVSGCPHT